MGLTSGNNGGTIIPKGYDFLNNIFGSESIPEDKSKKLDEIISVIPKKHLDVIDKTIKKVELVSNRGYCSYDNGNKTLIL